MGGELTSVRPSVCVLTLSNMYISESKRPIATKFYLKHFLGWGKVAIGFGPNRIRTLFSMAAPIGLYWGKSCDHSSAFIFNRIFLNFRVMRTTTTSLMSSKFGQIRPRTAEIAPVERLEKSP